MEIITLFAVLCLVLIVVSGILKQARAQKLVDAITTIKKAIEEDGIFTKQQLIWGFRRELDEMAGAVGRIESKAILDYPIIEEFVRSLTPECYKVDPASRLELIASGYARSDWPQWVIPPIISESSRDTENLESVAPTPDWISDHTKNIDEQTDSERLFQRPDKLRKIPETSRTSGSLRQVALKRQERFSHPIKGNLTKREHPCPEEHNSLDSNFLATNVKNKAA